MSRSAVVPIRSVAATVGIRPPCKNVRLLEIQKRRITPLLTKTVLALEKGVQDRYKAIIMLGAGTGVRISDALGLMLDRIDFLGKTVTIDQQLLRVSSDVPVLGPVKDRKNRPRVIPLPETVVDALAAHIAEFPIASSGLVFTNQDARPIRRTAFGVMFRFVADPLGIPKGESFHQLRHFYASALIRSGESEKVVQERLGHASVMTTLEQYGHLWPDNHATTRAAMDSIFALGHAPESRPVFGALA
jgi:integrase